MLHWENPCTLVEWKFWILSVVFGSWLFLMLKVLWHHLIVAGSGREKYIALRPLNAKWWAQKCILIHCCYILYFPPSKCKMGQWDCRELPCPGTCSLEGGSFVTTFDSRPYRFHGVCTYILMKVISLTMRSFSQVYKKTFRMLTLANSYPIYTNNYNCLWNHKIPTSSSTFLV